MVKLIFAALFFFFVAYIIDRYIEETREPDSIRCNGGADL
jgi:hypothetical protein